MPFPFKHASGNICCTNKTAMCDDCKAKLAAEAGRTSRGAAGKRHSATDQGHLDSAHAHVITAIGHLGAAGAQHDASSVGAPGASVAIEEEVEQRERAPRTAAEHYQTTVSRTFATMRAEQRVIEARDAAHVPETRTLEAPEDVPNGYAMGRTTTQSDLEPDFDPSYQPYGAPPDSYTLALALRKLKEDAS